MRIRSTKPDFWRSKTIASLSWDVRLVLKGLESYVDDNGVGKDDIALIAADVFPRDLSANPRDTLARLTEAISQLSEGGLIARYEIDGEDLLYIDKWKDLQRIDKPGKGRHPRPDGTFEYTETVNRETYRNIRESVARAPEVVAPGTGEQGSSGTGEQSSLSEPDGSDEGPERLDAKRLTDALVEALKSRNAKTPASLKAWNTEARRILDIDNRPLNEALQVLAWSQADPFWSTNILSMGKFREKYDQLRLKAGDAIPETRSPEDLIRECWQQGSVKPITDATGMEPEAIRWPEPEPDDFDADDFRRQCRRDWIKSNRDDILARLRRTS